MSSTSATSPSRPSRHGRAKSTLTAFQPRPTDDEPLDDLELVRRFDRLTNSRLAKEKSSFHHLYVPDETESRRPGLVDGVLWLAERIFVGPPPKPHKRQHSDRNLAFGFGKSPLGDSGTVIIQNIKDIHIFNSNMMLLHSESLPFSPQTWKVAGDG